MSRIPKMTVEDKITDRELYMSSFTYSLVWKQCSNFLIDVMTSMTRPPWWQPFNRRRYDGQQEMLWRLAQTMNEYGDLQDPERPPTGPKPTHVITDEAALVEEDGMRTEKRWYNI